MLIAITGTPGTGKKALSEKMREMGEKKKIKKYLVMGLDEIEKKFIIGMDEKRDCSIVDTDAMNEFINEMDEDKPIFIQGHLSHLLPCVSKIIILRKDPRKLRKELEKRKWPRKKIEENVEAEILDIISCQAFELHGEKNVWEIDVTDKKPSEIVKEISKILDGNFEEGYGAGKVDWTHLIC